MNFGLQDKDLQEITSIIEKEPAVDEVIIFGSRAKGNFKTASDIDIAVKGANINFSTISHLSYILNEESSLPYHFDVLNFYAIENINLFEHINRVGQVIFKRST